VISGTVHPSPKYRYLCMASTAHKALTDGLYTKGTRAHTHRALIREWLWEPKGGSPGLTRVDAATLWPSCAPARRPPCAAGAPSLLVLHLPLVPKELLSYRVEPVDVLVNCAHAWHWPVGRCHHHAVARVELLWRLAVETHL